MKPKIPLISSFVMLIFLSGCGSGGLFVPSVTPSPTSTSTVTPTTTPLPITDTPSITNTPSVTIITGTIVDPASLPLVDIPVQLYKNKNQIIAETKTNEQGEYTFKVMSPGTYRIRYDIVLSPTYIQHHYTAEFVVESETTIQWNIVHKN